MITTTTTTTTTTATTTTTKLLLITCLTWVATPSDRAIAQVIPAADGINTQVQQQSDEFTITGGVKSNHGSNLFHSFDRFNLSATQTAKFLSEPAIRHIFARIRGGEASVINGTLQINGGLSNLFLINPTGILFGPNVRLNLPALFAATTATGIQFDQGIWNVDSSDSPAHLASHPQQLLFALQNPGSIINSGNLTAASGQAISLTGGNVINTGVINAPGGPITIAAIPGRQQVRISQAGSVISFDVAQSPDRNLTTDTLAQLLTKGQNIRHAPQLTVNAAGKVQLQGSGLTIDPTTPTTLQAGTIATSARDQPGAVQILGTQVILQGATVQANSDRASGGQILIGGDFQGQGQVPTAQITQIDATSKISANGNRDGGKVIVWANRDTTMQGTITATGGSSDRHDDSTSNSSSDSSNFHRTINSNNGGFVEVSGKSRLNLTGKIDVSAPQGKAGKVLLDPQDIVIGNAPSSATVPSATAPSASALPDNNSTSDPFLLSPAVFTQIKGEIELNADRSIWLQATNISGTNLGQGGTITFRAGTSFRADTNMVSQGRSIVIQAPTITTQGITTTLANASAGSVTLQGLDGTRADKITTGNIITPNQDVQIEGKTIRSDIILTGAGTLPQQGGKVTLTGTDRMDVAGIFTNQQDVQLRSSTNGVIQAGPMMTLGGAVAITAGRLDAGLIWTSPNGVGNAGNITLQAQGNLETRQLEASGKQFGRSGQVSVISAQGDVTIDSIQAYGDQGGGRAILSGDNVRITGVRYDQTLPSQAFTTSSIRVDESIAIRHHGGRSNQPFIIGDPTFNGSNGQLVANGQALVAGAFPIAPQTTEYLPLNQPTIAITAVNQIPTLPELKQAKLLQRNVEPGSRTVFTLAELGFKPPQDADRDLTPLYIRARSTSAPGQLLDPYGRPITATVPVRLSDRLTYIAPSYSATINTFEIIATDLPNQLATLDQYPRIVLRLGSPPIPPQEPIAPTVHKPNAEVPEGTPVSNVSAQEAAKMDNELSQDYIANGIAIASATPPDGVALLRQVESQMKKRPALVYLRTQLNELEITLITAQGRFRKRVPVSRERLFETITAFRREVTNPLKTHTKSYLSSARRLYQWMIEPILGDLHDQDINNLVFLPESGLRSVPYAALHNGRQFLIEQYSVALMPSLGLTQIGYQDFHSSQMLAIGVAQSTQGQSPLPMVPTELSTIAKIWPDQTTYLDQSATLKNLQTARQQHPFQIVHLATHANFSTEVPKNAYIQMWNEQLKLEQIRELGWSNPPVELLVLSACRTAIGNRESELGFAGLAIQTGVKTAVASLWYVNDTATTGLISQFYHSLKIATAKADGLQQAQIAMATGRIIPNQAKITGLSNQLEIPLPLEAQINDTDFRHPYYWAAFTMIGNPW
jgi:filamentous hemagglutinin family protein